MSTVTVVATVEASNLPPRVKLDVTDVGTPNVFAATVTRLDPDGRVVPVRTFDGNPLTLTTSGANRVGTVYDYEMPYGALVSYSTLESPSTTSAEVVVEQSKAWLVHPGVPELSQQVTIAAVGSRSRGASRSVLYPMGRATPVVVTSGARRAPEYALSLLTLTDDERADIEAIIADAGTLLFNVPATNAWGIGAEYVAVGDVQEARPARYLGDPARVWELSCTVVDRPAGGSQAARTFADVLADFATFADVQAAYPDFAALLAGP